MFTYFSWNIEMRALCWEAIVSFHLKNLLSWSSINLAHSLDRHRLKSTLSADEQKIYFCVSSSIVKCFCFPLHRILQVSENTFNRRVSTMLCAGWRTGLLWSSYDEHKCLSCLNCVFSFNRWDIRKLKVNKKCKMMTLHHWLWVMNFSAHETGQNDLLRCWNLYMFKK